MILALIRQTREQIRGILPAALVDTRPLRTKARLLVLAAVPVLALAAWHPDLPVRTLALVTHPLAHLPPADIFIHVATRDVRVIRGAAVSVEAVTSGARPDSVELVFRPSRSGQEAAATQTVGMNRGETDRYAAVLPEVVERPGLPGRHRTVPVALVQDHGGGAALRHGPQGDTSTRPTTRAFPTGRSPAATFAASRARP